MSFQFNFSVEEDEAECTGLSDLQRKRETPEDSTHRSEDKEVQLKLSTKNKETGIEQNSSLSKSDILNSSSTGKDCKTEEKPVCCKPAVEHKIPQDVSRVLENKIVEQSSDLQFVNVSVVEMTLSNEDSHGENIVSRTVTANSDLISGVYEGGMKIWECTFDLIKYIEDEDVSFKGKSVLDLGCGAGLLGIVALKRKAKEVHFQDYNSTVIEEITIPNALVNCDSGDGTGNVTEEPNKKRVKKSETSAGLLDKCRFFSGDWSHLTLLMQNQTPSLKYDIILTSETIYNPDYYSALHDLFQHLLADSGTVYLASKSHYFGVGGGVLLFETFVKRHNLFHINTLKTHDDGLQRMLLSLSFKDQ
ncbi:PREDICTED: histidine protein methyltransferase 1 homolog [Nanorana parkeri]|uniref:histidine protein methyltransferase 1 homolog n=1 Tax=Nanorana parkeri TaxID=125878 RepID=UPI000854B7C9|nr:PREDICTED: histidine protein methyltransferase 1 homolog [Nanorana parkeri]